MLDNYENNLYDILNELTKKYPELDLVPIIANVREMNRLDEIFAEYKPNIVFHAAAPQARAADGEPSRRSN